jgi:catechol 2,3-dioxygenase-like lactoylglutathione lyase family enzyme
MAAVKGPAVRGIVETALYVADLARTAAFYRRVFGFGVLLESERLIALEVAGRDVLLLFLAGATLDDNCLPGGVIPGHGSTGRGHLAFVVGAEELTPWRERLAAEGVAMWRSRARQRGRVGRPACTSAIRMRI